MINVTRRKARRSPLGRPFGYPPEDWAADHRIYAARKILKHGGGVANWAREVERLLRQGQQAFELNPPLLHDIVNAVVGEAIDWGAWPAGNGIPVPAPAPLGPFSRSPFSPNEPDDRDYLAINLPVGIGSRQAIRWAIRAHAGESYGKIAVNTDANAKTVEWAARMAARAVGLSLDTQENVG